MKSFFNIKILFTTFLLVLQAQASVVNPEQLVLLGGKTSAAQVSPLNASRIDLWLNQLLLNRDYQIGGEWGKKAVTDADLRSSAVFSRMAHATAKVRSATGFYLGEFKGQYVVATNHHVCPRSANCSPGTSIQFTLLGLRVPIAEFYGTWPEIDLAMFSVRLTQAEAAKLNAVASPFSFNKDLYRGQNLLTIGHGVANNPGQTLMANQDSDCKVFSNSGEYRLMADPDEFNPGPYRAWSFSNGCDVSHGDSGSAMMDRETGDVVGIIWTGKIPKNQKIQNADYMKNLYDNPTEDVWNELSFAVPAASMKVFLKNAIDSNQFSANVAAVLSEMIGN